MTSPAVYDHFRPADADHPDGVYRVVGAGERGVTLLRVGDARGRRVNTGELLRLDALDGFESAENPDGNRRAGDVVASTVKTAYWSVRAFVQQLVANPLPATAALAFVVVGAAGEGIVPLPDVAFGGLIVVGSLGLAYVGSGRL
ncbi:hypothetical protein [Halorarum halobium]|uniref:hypothetical protein n=1 Tax=Halorarum halobium TaxID=3075121 RepID=UPI0028ACD4CD|nr:hypothetical protein [Halobaculum sp. XH14]